VRAVAPKPLNVVISASGGPSVAELADLGVRRISIGGGLARAAFGAALAVAQQLHAGSFAGFAGVTSHGELNAIFKTFG
jgi:2-methylisocitrate lyase-like PEP mutase family enzyme